MSGDLAVQVCSAVPVGSCQLPPTLPVKMDIPTLTRTFLGTYVTVIVNKGTEKRKRNPDTIVPLHERRVDHAHFGSDFTVCKHSAAGNESPVLRMRVAQEGRLVTARLWLVLRIVGRR